ncbi:MAG: hypothetical protein K2I24_02575, partial [Duncaniella sp.]|nr:hypothetical protein [Duncaniella sp.]
MQKLYAVYQFLHCNIVRYPGKEGENGVKKRANFTVGSFVFNLTFVDFNNCLFLSFAVKGGLLSKQPSSTQCKGKYKLANFPPPDCEKVLK